MRRMKVELKIFAQSDQRTTSCFMTGIFRRVLGFLVVFLVVYTYCQIFDMKSTKFQNFHVSRLVLQLSLRSILKPGVKPRMEM